MVLSGTLREFILADVFQLLSQQKITGKLVLSNGRAEGSVIFRNGLIVSAENDEEKLQRKLFNYLVEVRNSPAANMRELFAGFENDLDGLTAEIIKQNLLPQEEMVAFAEGIVEDLACSLFLWTKGTYRFNSFRNVDPLVPAGVSIATENIVMEAMRRVDEWHRMQEFISEDIVFVRSEKDGYSPRDVFDIKTKPEEYLYLRIDGTSTVQSLVRNSCLSEYRVYESLHVLIQNSRIVPLSDKLSSSIKAALHKKEQESLSAPVSVTLSVLGAAGAILAIVLLGWFFLRGFILSGPSTQSRISCLELRLAQAENKASVAQFHFRALHGFAPERLGDLRSASLLSGADLQPYRELKSRLVSSKEK